MKRENLIKAIVPIISIGFGLIIGPLLEKFTSPLFDNPTKAILTSITIFSFILILFLTGVYDSIAKSKETQEEAKRQLNDISKKLGLSVNFFDYSRLSEKTTSWEEAIKLVENATSEILVLDYHPAEGIARYYDKNPKDTLDRQRYYATLIKKAKKGIKYKRLLQFADGPKNEISKKHINDSTFINHCNEMLELGNQLTLPNISLKRTGVFLPETTLIIIDKRYIDWEIVVQTPDGKLNLAGDLLFDDTTGEFAIPLGNILEKIDDSAVLVTQLTE